MHLLLYPFVFFSSVVTATPILQASNDDFADWFPSFQAVNSDIINPSNLNDASENIFSNLDANVGDETLSSDSIGDWHGMSSDTLTDTFADTLGDTLSVEPQSDFSDDSGSIAFSDSPSLSQFSPNQDSSYDRSIDGALISKLIKVQATSPPACSSLIGPNSDIEFKSLCCESPCMDDQSWRRSCRSCIFNSPGLLITTSAVAEQT